MVRTAKLVQAEFQGREREPVRIQDLGAREMAMATALLVAIIWLGLYPRDSLSHDGISSGAGSPMTAPDADPARSARGRRRYGQFTHAIRLISMTTLGGKAGWAAASRLLIEAGEALV
jgi:hypothetical protein